MLTSVDEQGVEEGDSQRLHVRFEEVKYPCSQRGWDRVAGQDFHEYPVQIRSRQLMGSGEQSRDDEPVSIFERCNQLGRRRVGVAEHQLAPDLLCARLAYLVSVWRCRRERDGLTLLASLTRSNVAMVSYPDAPALHQHTAQP